MSDLSDRLDRTLTGIEPGPAPVEAAMARGRRIRTRRRAAMLGGAVAVIAAAVVSVPALAHHQALPGPAASHLKVTVNPPGPNAPAGTIATGVIGTRPWNVRVRSPHTKNCLITGAGLAFFSCNGVVPTTDAADPVVLAGTSGTDKLNGGLAETFFVSFGAIRKDVTSVRVVLADGAVLSPRPITLDGTRWIAFANPVSVSVTSLTAYSATGEIATSIPFDGPEGRGVPSFAVWLRPGQAGLARMTKRIASGTSDGQAWAMTAYVGPWGTCVAGGNGTGCFQPTPVEKGIELRGGMGLSSGSGVLIWGAVESSISYLIVTPENGAAMRVDVTDVSGQKYFACYLGHEPKKGDRWTGYNAAGQTVASGSFTYS